MNFITQLGVLIIILVILIILIKSNQTLEKIYMEEEQEVEQIELPKIKISEVKLPKWSFKNKTSKKAAFYEDDDENEKESYESERQHASANVNRNAKRPIERSSGTMPVDTSAKWSIEVLDDRGRVVENHRIYSYPFQIGRNGENDLVLDDLSVSGFHATVEDAYGSLELVDQGSLNKLIVNGCTVTNIEILDMMEVGFGNTRLRFRKEGKKSSPTIAYAGNSLMEEWH